MLRITEEQMQKLDQLTRDRGNRRIAEYVAERFPHAFAGYDEARKIAVIERMREAAAAFGFERDDHIGTYIDLFVMYGPGFESQPWAASILNDPDLSPAAKVFALKRRVSASGVEV